MNMLHKWLGKFTLKKTWKIRSLESTPSKLRALTGKRSFKRYRSIQGHPNQRQICPTTGSVDLV